MALRKRFPILAAATAAIIGVALYLPGSASFVNGIPVGSGYGGANCPVGLGFNVDTPSGFDAPNTLVYGQALAIGGQLVHGPSPSVPIGTQSIALKHVNAGTSAVLNTTTATTNSSGAFSKLYTPTYTAFHTGTWTDPQELCSDLTSGDNAYVRVRMGIASTKPFVQGLNGSGAPGTWWTIYGGVRPNKAGKTVNLKYRVLGSSTYKILTLLLDSHSNFRMTFSSGRHGVVFEFRAVYRAQDALNLGSATPFIFVHTI